MFQLKRTCAICGAELTISVARDRTYTGGHYFDFIDLGAEYWECNDCYEEWPK